MTKSPKKIKLSLIILNYNSGHYLADCLTSLYRSKLKDSIEIIIPDNKSTDNSIALAKKVKNTNKKILNTKYLLLNTNKGFSYGNNQAIKKISPDSRYVLFLNPDTTVETDTIQKSIDFLDSHPKASALTCKVILVKTDQIQPECHRNFPTPISAFLHFSGISSHQYFMQHLDYNKTQKINACVGAFIMLRRRVGDSLGWWNEKYFFYGEDLDLCYRLKKNGHQLFYYPGCQIRHFQGVSSGIKSSTKNLSNASRQTKAKVAKASTQAMRIFYQQNLFPNYSPLTRFIVNQGINLLESFRIFKAKYL